MLVGGVSSCLINFSIVERCVVVVVSCGVDSVLPVSVIIVRGAVVVIPPGVDSVFPMFAMIERCIVVDSQTEPEFCQRFGERSWHDGCRVTGPDSSLSRPADK